MHRYILSLVITFLFSLPLFAQPSASINQPYIDTILCAGNNLNVAYSVTSNYSAGNIFTVQLSDASGSFANPVNIGNLNAITAGSVNCLIPSITATGSGYRIRITTSNPPNISSDDGIDILISNLSALSISSNSPVCFGDSLYLDATDTTTGLNYNWTGPNSISASSQNIQTAFATFADSGKFLVTATFNGCSLTDSVDIIVKPSPLPLSTNSNSPICVNDSLHLMAIDTSSVFSFTWNGPNTFNTSSQDPNIANVGLADSGWYYVNVAGINGCHAQDSVFVTVAPLPALPTAGSNSPVCTGDSLFLTATDTTANIAYSWYGPDNFNILSQNPSIANVDTTNAGSYTLSVFLNGCSASISVPVIVNKSPALPSISSNSPVCIGNTLNLNSASSTSGVTFYWEGPGGFMDSTQNLAINNVQLNDSGVYKIYTRSGLCYSDTNGTIVTINPIVTPSVSISTNPSVVTIGSPIQFTANVTNGGPFPTVQWRNNGVDMPGYTVNPCNIILAAGDVISVIVHSDAPCPVPDTAVSAGVSTSVRSLELGIENWVLYPNPNMGDFIVEGEIPKQNSLIEIEILNVLGQSVYRIPAETTNGKLRTEVHLNIPGGIYMLRLTDEEGSAFSRQIIINK